MKSCISHHFGCDCRENKTKECLRTQYNKIKLLLFECTTDYSLEQIQSILSGIREDYEFLYGSVTLKDLD